MFASTKLSRGASQDKQLHKNMDGIDMVACQWVSGGMGWVGWQMHVGDGTEAEVQVKVEMTCCHYCTFT